MLDTSNTKILSLLQDVAKRIQAADSLEFNAPIAMVYLRALLDIVEQKHIEDVNVSLGSEHNA